MCVGKPAPPIPTIPAFFIKFLMSSLDKSSYFLFCPTPSALSYALSFSTTTDNTLAPDTVNLGSTATTVPETDEYTCAETNPEASPIL